MEELTWLILVIWLVMLLVYVMRRDTLMGGFGGAIGIFFGITLIDDANWLGFILIVLNIAVLYDAIVRKEGKK